MLGGSLEENVLTALVHSDTLAPHIALYVKAPDFSIQVYQKIAAAGLSFLESHRRPAKAHIGDLLEQEIKRGPDGRFIVDVLQQMRQLAPHLNEDYVRQSLDRFVETNRLTHAVNSASDLLHDGKLEEAREILRAPTLEPKKDEPGIWLRDTSRWLSFLDEKDAGELFTSGVEVLDEHGVRPRRGELYGFLAASGMGKSWFLINIGKENLIGVRARKKVLHITLENSLETTLQRYTQCFLSLHSHEAKQVDTYKFEERKDPDRVRRERTGPTVFEGIRSLGRVELERRLDQVQGRGQLLVKHFPTNTLTFGMLNAFLDSLEQEDFKPDLILLDYLTMMRLDARPEHMRVAIGLLARNLRGLAIMRNCAVVTAFQANRQAAGKRMVWGSMVSEDWSMHGTCDTFVTYNQTAHERDRGFARLLVDKSRNSDDKFVVFIDQAYAIGQFCYGSSYGFKHLEEQLEEGTGTP